MIFSRDNSLNTFKIVTFAELLLSILKVSIIIVSNANMMCASIVTLNSLARIKSLKIQNKCTLNSSKKIYLYLNTARIPKAVRNILFLSLKEKYTQPTNLIIVKNQAAGRKILRVANVSGTASNVGTTFVSLV